MDIDSALDVLRKCCENMDIDDNGHERECGKCPTCDAVATLEMICQDYRALLAEDAGQ